MSEPTGRYRVSFQTVMGWQAADFYSYAEAVEYAKRQHQPGWPHPEVLKEYESDMPFFADFRRIWP